MQWNTHELSNWEELRGYVDTALLPLYLYRQEFSLEEHLARMTYLCNVAAAIEQRLKGRILLYPLAYQWGDHYALQQIPEDFTHYVLLQFSGDPVRLGEQVEGLSLCRLRVSDEDLTSVIRFEVTVNVLYEEILRLWQNR